MAQIDNIVQVNISRNTTQIEVAAFDIPLLMVEMTDDDTAFTDRVRTYTSLDEVADDLGTAHAGYIMARSLLSGELKPAQFKIGKVNKEVGSEETYEEALIAVNDIDDTWYAVMAQSHEDADIMQIARYVQTLRKIYFFSTADGKALQQTQTVVYTAQVQFDVTTPVENDELNVYIAGERFRSVYTTAWSAFASTSGSPVFTGIFTFTPGTGLLSITNATTAFTVARATQVKDEVSFDVPAADITATDPVGMDIAQRLKFMGMDRSVPMYSATADSEYPEAGWVGPQIVEIPGSNTWEYKTIAGTTVSQLTSTNISLLESRGYNYYIRVKGANITRRGKVAEGEWVDVMILVDWLHARIQEQIFFRLINSRKIPYTDAGAVIIENEIRSVLAQAQANGGIDQYTVTSPRVLSIPEMQRNQRVMGDFTFDARLAGAISVVVIRGVVHA
jgi:hypothetical protein